MSAATATIDVSFGQYTIPYAQLGEELPWSGNALLETTVDGIITVCAGTTEGPLRLTVETYDSEPPLELEGWDDVVEVSRITSGGTISVCELFQAPRDDLPRLCLAPGSSFRVRCHVRGRDEGSAHDRLPPDADPVEEHLLQLWPASPAQDVCHRLTDWFGQVWRAHTRPPGRTSLASARTTVAVHRSQYWLLDPDRPLFPDLPPGLTALLNVWKGSVVVYAGTQEGSVWVRAEIYKAAPPLELEGWEQVVEVSHFSRSGRTRVCELDRAPLQELPELRLSPQSWFRVRCHARNRDWAAAYSHRVPQAIEEHLLQMWPAPQAEDLCHRSHRPVLGSTARASASSPQLAAGVDEAARPATPAR